MRQGTPCLYNYYPFGMEQEQNCWTDPDYKARFGFQGMENGVLAASSGNAYTTPFRQYDPRLGQWLAPDPMFQPWQSPYNGLNNNPISVTDPLGLDGLNDPLNGNPPTGGGIGEFLYDLGCAISDVAPDAGNLLMNLGEIADVGEQHSVDSYTVDCPDGTYCIQDGDNFWDLEEKWGIDHGTLESLNPDLDPNNLQIGQNIVAHPDIPLNGYSPLLIEKEITTTRIEEVQVRKPKVYLSGSVLMAGAVVLADDVSVVGIADDGALVPIAGVLVLTSIIDGAAYLAPERVITESQEVSETSKVQVPNQYYYVTYTKYNSELGLMYVGRSSGYGSPERAVRSRDYNHHKKASDGWEPAVLSTFLPATVPGGYSQRSNDPSYWAIRGSEQLQIEFYREMGISGNGMNGVGPRNLMRDTYIQEALKHWSKY